MGEEELQKILDKLIEFGSRMISGSTGYLSLFSFRYLLEELKIIYSFISSLINNVHSNNLYI